MADAELEAFVHEALRAGASRDEIERVLREAGWSKDQYTSALGAYSPVSFVVPVPRPRVQLSARDAFAYLVMFGALYFSAFHVGNLVFQFINLAMPDPVADQYRRITNEIRWSTSVVLVAFPVFLFMAARIARSIAAEPVRRTSAIRKWLTYLTLTIAVSTVAGDLVYLLNSLLSGELTLRFLLKCLTVAAIAGSVLGYYLWMMREDDKALEA
jgi:hypothetical protein